MLLSSASCLLQHYTPSSIYIFTFYFVVVDSHFLLFFINRTPAMDTDTDYLNQSQDIQEEDIMRCQAIEEEYGEMDDMTRTTANHSSSSSSSITEQVYIQETCPTEAKESKEPEKKAAWLIQP